LINEQSISKKNQVNKVNEPHMELFNIMIRTLKIKNALILSILISAHVTSFSQGKIIMNGAKMTVVNSAYVVTQDVSLTNTSSIDISNSTIKIGDSIKNNSGIFDVTDGTVEMNGTSGQTIPLQAFSTNKIKNLVISNNVTLAGQDSITGVLSFGGSNMNFATSDSLTIKSTAAGTASVADITNGGINTGNTITGKVIVERYNSARKGWRFLSIPTNTAQTVKQAWQEGSGGNINTLSGYGTQITGAGGTAAGFDVYTAAPSMKTYVPSSDTWAGIANTNTLNIKNTIGYMVFDRGDRTVISAFAAPTQTVLRSKGTLYTNDQPSISVTAGKFASIGNPYASAVDMRNITKTGMKDFFYVWDPNLGGSSGYGGYQTFSNLAGSYIITPGMGSYGPSGTVVNDIESGQAFLVQADSTGGSISFKEGDKVGGSAMISAPPGLSHPLLRINLYGVKTDGSTYMADGLLINYDDNFSNRVDGMDAIKSPNSGENFSVKTGNTLLVVERRHSIVKQDTVFLNLTGTTAQKYRIDVEANELEQAGMLAFLEDNYLHTSTPLNLNGDNPVDFNVTNVAGSYAPNRFRIVFNPYLVLPVTFTSIKAYPKNKDIVVEWKVENESNLKQYDVEKSVDGSNYATNNTVVAKNAAASVYQFLDEKPVDGYNYYRVKSTDINGKMAYSTVVKVLIGKMKQEISVYPNPIVNGVINLQLLNQPAGKYGIRLISNNGQVITSKEINHPAGNGSESIQLNKYLSGGIYELEVTKPDGNIVNINVTY
jgi:hypothetical protein